MLLLSSQSAVRDLPSKSCVTSPFSDAVLSALQRGQMVDAIRLLQLEQHIGVNDAKQHIDAYLLEQPRLRDQIDRIKTDAREGIFRWITFLFIGGIGLAYVLI